jgi:hypothetical protein
MTFLAQTSAVDGIMGSFAGVPFGNLAALFSQIMPAFVFVAAVMLLAGYTMHLASQGEPFHVTGRLVALFAVLACSLWTIQTGQRIVNALVGVIAALDPALNWLVVPNPDDNALSMNFGQLFVIIGRYVTGTWSNGPSLWELFHWGDYAWRLILVGLAGFSAWATAFLMELMLVLQKLILIGARPFVPLFVAGLLLPSVQGSSQSFFKDLVGVMCWPIGWALGHVVTLYLVRGLQTPSWAGSPGDVFFATIQLAVLCLWMLLVTFGAPAAIQWTVHHGGNFSGRLAGSMAGALSTHAANLTRSGATVAGGLVGLPGGPAGVALGAQVGSAVGGFAASPLSNLARSASAAGGYSHPIPSSRSAAAADAAIRSLKKHA